MRLPRHLLLFAGLVTGLWMQIASAQGLPPNVRPLDTPQPMDNDGKIEVLEFFGYGCIHCANLEPVLDAWSKKLPPDVKLKRVPAGFGHMGVDDVVIYHTIEAMGLAEKLHAKIFTALHNDHAMLGHKPTFLKWLEKQGVDPKQYESVEKSFSVQSKIMRGRGMAERYKITATPTIVVGGRYVVETPRSGGFPEMLAMVDRIVSDARVNAAAGTAAAGKSAPAKSTAKPASAASK